MSIRSVVALFAVVAVVMFHSGSAYAVDLCGPDAVDPDGDGWGWENNMSCRLTVIERPEPPVCMDAGSDPDGDGWGWENGASCRVAGSAEPGDSFETAGLVEIDNPFNGTMYGEDTHYYRFEVEGSVGVELQSNFNTQGSLDLLISNGDNDIYEDGYSEAGNICLSTGTYYIVLNRYYIDTVVNVNYTISIDSLELPCVEPVSGFAVNEDFYETAVTSDGEVYQYRYDSDIYDYVLEKYDADGARLWSTVVNSGDFIEPIDDGTVLFGGDNSISLIDANGVSLWQVDLGELGYFDVTDVAIGTQSAIVYGEGKLLSYSLADGSLRWRFDVNRSLYSYSFAELTVTDEGTVVLAADGHVYKFIE